MTQPSFGGVEEGERSDLSSQGGMFGQVPTKADAKRAEENAEKAKQSTQTPIEPKSSQTPTQE